MSQPFDARKSLTAYRQEAMSGAERIARYRAKHAATKPTTKTKSTADAIALAAEVARLKGESAELRKLNVALMREVAILKDESRARESL